MSMAAPQQQSGGIIQRIEEYNRAMLRRLGLDVRLAYYTGGGIARYIRHLAADLPAQDPANAHTHFYRRGHNVTFSGQARRVDCWTPAHHRLERLTLAAELWPHRLDLLHSPDFIPPLSGYRRSVITVHDLTFLLYPEFLTPASRRYYNDQIAWAVRRADAISADSHATKADLIERLKVPPEKITVIHLGLGPGFGVDGRASGPLLAELGLVHGYLLFVGTFEPRKNVPGLLTAYSRLRSLLPDAPPLVLAGRRGWLFEKVQECLHELELEAHVRFLEEVSEPQLRALYHGAAVFVLPSHYEGFGFTVLEAMASGTPTIVANRASLPEIAGDAALQVDPDDPDGLADSLRRALTDTALRDQMIARGLAQARRFTWQQTTAATLALYQRVLADL
jgi:glycosyltransferase involved in cell wall biosynthesis